MTMWRAFAAIGLISLSAVLGRSAEPPVKPAAPEPSGPPPPLVGATLAPSLKAAADRDHVLLYHIDPPATTPVEGDSTVAWIGATDGKVTRQWLIQFRRGSLTPKEQKAGRKKDQTKYLSWGSVVVFKSQMEALDLWIAGPVVVSELAKPEAVAPVKRVRVLVPADYLRLGLDNSARVTQHFHRRVAALKKEDPNFEAAHLYALDEPIKPENVAYAKPVAAKIGYTPEMERAWCGGFVALQAFYELATDVSELEAIASVAIDRPSIFKLAKLATGTRFLTSLGGPETRAVDPASLGLVPVAAESFDISYGFWLGKDLIVSGAMVVSQPSPPVDTTAGVLALRAIHPKDTRRQVHVAVISAVRGERPATPTAP